MIMVTRIRTHKKIGINPNHIVAVDLCEDNEGGSYLNLRTALSYRILETPDDVEDLISKHHTKYTRG